MKQELATPEQKKRLWAIATDLAKSGIEYAGMRLNKNGWKVLLVASVYGQKCVPALDNDGIVWVDAKTSRMTRAQISEVIAFAEAWCAEKGIELSDEQGE